MPGLCHYVSVFSIRRPSDRRLARLAADQAGRALTYAEVGATPDRLPAGYVHYRAEVDLGRFEPELFRRAAAALGRWDVQRGAGLAVFPDEPIRPGVVFALAVRLPAGYATAAGRVIRVIDQPGHFGFAYGTLPAHPECGEETFDLLRENDRLLFRVIAFSRQRHPAARIGGPVARTIQRRVNRQYLTAMREIVRPEAPVAP